MPPLGTPRTLKFSLLSTQTTNLRQESNNVYRLWSQSTCLWIPFLPFISSMTLSKPFKFLGPISLLPTPHSFVVTRINEVMESVWQNLEHSERSADLLLLLPNPRAQHRARPRTETQSTKITSMKDQGSVSCLHFPHFRLEQVSPWIRYRSITSAGNSTCFSMSRMVSSEVLSFDFFSLFIALVRTFRKESLALLVFCLASLASISLCSLVTLIKEKNLPVTSHCPLAPVCHLLSDGGWASHSWHTPTGVLRVR